ncbi:nuclear transport factor 2 family protein [Haloactinomyces albus]|uniref:Uncharacterized protein (TIGR02246 family) n=1 Tax=Haloactinomyces albus TaxID=1352928 RepID=A0AAE3ZH25_9ACTN|nr:nuclear transport factor 2 family protein [Haloactinomyces albus]MDR7303960.1 uncharacterized protein (TIGR02246 family) [Haloactinomyces albus]
MSAFVENDSVIQSADIAVRIERIEAQEAIRRLVYEYSHGFDKREPDRFVAVWTENAFWSAGPGHEASGRTAIREAAEAMWEQLGPTHHWSCNPVVDIHGAEATAVTNVHAVAQGSDGAWTQTAATYRDRFERVDGVWLLARRSTETHHTFSIAAVPA